MFYLKKKLLFYVKRQIVLTKFYITNEAIFMLNTPFGFQIIYLQLFYTVDKRIPVKILVQ